MDGKPLSPKQQAFVDHFIVHRNAMQAAIHAGYAEGSAKVTGSRLLTNANVKAAIANLVSIVSKEAVIDAAYVLAGFVENAQRAMQRVPVLDKEGNPTGEWKYEGSVANRAFEMIGKHIGFFPAEKRELTGKDGAPLGTLIITTEQKQAIGQRLMQRLGRRALEHHKEN